MYILFLANCFSRTACIRMCNRCQLKWQGLGWRWWIKGQMSVSSDMFSVISCLILFILQIQSIKQLFIYLVLGKAWKCKLDLKFSLFAFLKEDVIYVYNKVFEMSFNRETNGSRIPVNRIRRRGLELCDRHFYLSTL